VLRLIDALLPLLARRSSRARGRLAYRMLVGLASTERQIHDRKLARSPGAVTTKPGAALTRRSRGFRPRENP